MKEIIQNNIDVSKCEFYQMVNDEPDKYDFCNQWGDSRTTFCSENPDCSFKQSVINDQKLKQSIIQYEVAVEQNRDLQTELKKYKQALDEIKDICCAKIKNCHIGCFICSTKCNENKILAIINKAKEVNNETL